MDEPVVSEIRTSVVLPLGLWMAAKNLATARRLDLRKLIIEGLGIVVMADKGDAVVTLKKGGTDWTGGGPTKKAVLKKKKGGK